jgi:hypothetical protein
LSFFTALTLSGTQNLEDLILSWKIVPVKFYTIAAIMALALGFLGLELYNIVERISGLKNNEN